MINIAKKKPKDMNEIKKDVDNLDNIRDIFEVLDEKSLFFDKDLIKKSGNADLFLKLKVLNSELKDKQDINEKIELITHHLSVLKICLLTKDKDKIKSSMNKILDNNETKISTIIDEVKLFDKKIDEIKQHYSLLIKNTRLSLDTKILLEQEYEERIKKLETINKKQKEIVFHLGKSFVDIVGKMKEDSAI